MAVITTTIAVGKWSSRASLSYTPCNSGVNGKVYNPFGVEVGHPLSTHERRPYKIEENGTTTYIMYDDDSKGNVPIYRIQEA